MERKDEQETRNEKNKRQKRRATRKRDEEKRSEAGYLDSTSSFHEIPLFQQS